VSPYYDSDSMANATMAGVKELRYYVMLALYFPILLYAFSTFDLDENTYAVQGIEPVVVGEQTVVLGQPFKARAFLAVSEGQGQQLVGEGSLEAQGDSVFQMPTGGLLGPDETEKSVAYNGRFRFSQVGGDEVELPVSGQFSVRRPDIVITSETMQALYRASRNVIRVDVPGLEDRQLRLQVGRTAIDGRTATLAPAGDTETVRVFLADDGGDVYLGQRSFTVIDPPRPELEVTNAGRPISNGDNLPKARAILEFSVVPDQEFRRRYPSDARYSIARATIYLRKGLTASERVGTYDLENGRLVLTRVLRDARPGDRVMVELDGIVRINHAGRAIPVQLVSASRTFGFVIS